MKADIVLTVAESKRLIAKGVVATEYVQEKMAKGIIVVTSGSTNAYVYEEILGTSFEKLGYLTGRTTPAKGTSSWDVESTPDLVLVDGKPAPDLDRFSALAKMKPGDIYVKGANALNYGAGVAGVSIGHPTGGTVGGSIGSIVSKKLRLLIPIGLEKELAVDISEAAARIAETDEHLNKVYSLWPIEGTIYTEIEALDTLFGIDVIPVAAGGIAGAEGAVRLLLDGYEEAVKEAVAFIETIQGEPALGA